ncbi:branched-chain amino acid ABC transporter permease [Oceanicola sp. 22II-s10i]|uniref:branched-chain amino acid ABC transporter permease n=1 Tax=Oceanicola sp. 22II-s10i TaxID=1317116 RepID=UPI000B5259A1|nr:branched-chain amino acid ABC transporter permease [Oceanicola sp. 22II-s10i]OWU83135.1 branched-chain amino acid ABC transporter permease [Oceanicola sp. 22II-s10i]
MDWILFLELAANGAVTGLLYAMVAISIVLIFKSSAVPNLAQGALVMVGAYAVLAFSDWLGLPMWLAIPAAMVFMFGLGIGIERHALRRLAGQPIIMILMMTLGLDIFLRGITLAAFGGSARRMDLGISDDPLFVGQILMSRVHLTGAAVALMVFAALVLFFRTRRGIRLRAISNDYVASWSVGIGVEQGVALSWALAAVISTIAGVFWGAVQGVDQSLSLLLLKSLTVAVLGGLDSLPGAIVAGILLGVLESVVSGYLDPLVGGGSRELVVAVTLILTVLIRPHGLFGDRSVERI